MDDIIKKSINVGISGSFAMVTQVTSLMWLRTIMNYQYVNGTNFKQSTIKLYNNGGILRFYKGYPLALINGPISRFGDTACNTAVLELTKNTNLPISIKTSIASLTAGLWRLAIIPIDCVKINYQVNGNLDILKNNISKNGVKTLYNGAMASATATVAGHYPWFVTYNYLNHYFPENLDESNLNKLIKRGTIGLTSSIISDTTSNSIRVVKTFKQTDPKNLKYMDIVKHLNKKEPLTWIFRGLKTKILSNGLNSIIFSISWKYFQERFN